MPPKSKRFSERTRKGFIDCGGKGSHSNYMHLGYDKLITISGKLGDDAKHYQVKAVRLALKELEQ